MNYFTFSPNLTRSDNVMKLLVVACMKYLQRSHHSFHNELAHLAIDTFTLGARREKVSCVLHRVS